MKNNVIIGGTAAVTFCLFHLFYFLLGVTGLYNFAFFHLFPLIFLLGLVFAFFYLKRNKPMAQGIALGIVLIVVAIFFSEYCAMNEHHNIKRRGVET